jgi:ADP-ribosylglycohydrolase
MKESSTCLLGAIAGDVIGSVYEFTAPKSTDFVLFTPSSQITDDSILTLAVADAILNKGSYRDRIQEFARAYPWKRIRWFLQPLDICGQSTTVSQFRQRIGDACQCSGMGIQYGQRNIIGS